MQQSRRSSWASLVLGVLITWLTEEQAAALPKTPEPQPDPGFLVVKTDPPGAELLVNGTVVDVTPTIAEGLPLDKDIEIVVRLGKATATKVIRLNKKERHAQVSFTLYPLPPAASPGGERNEAKDPPVLEARKRVEDGNRAIQLGDYDAAVDRGLTALKIDPQLADAHKMLGVAYARQGRYCLAKQHYGQYMRKLPDSPMNPRIQQIIQGEDYRACP